VLARLPPADEPVFRMFPGLSIRGKGGYHEAELLWTQPCVRPRDFQDIPRLFATHYIAQQR